MTTIIIISFCSLLLIAYVFDLTSAKTRIPSVILLLLLGWVVRQLTDWFNFQLPDFSQVLPALGTVGLILIVLEGSLELELNRSKLRLIATSFTGALLAMLAMVFLLAFGFSYFGGYGLKQSMINAIPFCVISSSIAIPAARNLAAKDREFVTYESSLSDILAVLLFNFLAINEVITAYSFGHFALQVLIILVVSFVATIGLAFLLDRIEHHVKFVPIILLIVLIYAASKYYHLPALIFILLFGLSIGNLDELKRFRFIRKLNPDGLDGEVKKFRELTIEATFLIRSIFFLLFGYLIETHEVLNAETFLWALAIVLTIIILRWIQLKISGLPLKPLLFLAPRGLITILLFLSIPLSQSISLVNRSLTIQVIILSALFMMAGLIATKTERPLKKSDS